MPLVTSRRRLEMLSPRTTFAIAAALSLVGAAPSHAQAPATDPARSEISVFGGVSLLGASRTNETSISLPEFPEFPGFPGYPGRPRLPDFGDVRVRTET